MLPTLVFKNQFGEETIGTVLQGGSTMIGAQLPASIQLLTGATAPVNGTTGDNVAGTGSLYIAQDTGVLYMQTGAITNPTWVSVGSSGAAALLTGYSSTTGVVAATDTIVQGVSKLNGNAAAIKVTADAALPSASFTAAAVTGKLLTGLAAGSNTPITATDSILVALANLQAQISAL